MSARILWICVCTYNILVVLWMWVTLMLKLFLFWRKVKWNSSKLSDQKLCESSDLSGLVLALYQRKIWPLKQYNSIQSCTLLCNQVILTLFGRNKVLCRVAWIIDYVRDPGIHWRAFRSTCVEAKFSGTCWRVLHQKVRIFILLATCGMTHFTQHTYILHQTSFLWYLVFKKS